MSEPTWQRSKTKKRGCCAKESAGMSLCASEIVCRAIAEWMGWLRIGRDHNTLFCSRAAAMDLQDEEADRLDELRSRTGSFPATGGHLSLQAAVLWLGGSFPNVLFQRAARQQERNPGLKCQWAWDWAVCTHMHGLLGCVQVFMSEEATFFAKPEMAASMGRGG